MPQSRSVTTTDDNLAAGFALFRNGRLDLAERYLKLGLAAEPLNARAHAQYASCLAANGKHEAALIEANEAIRLAPQDPGSYDALVDVWFGIRRWRDAIVPAREALRLGPADPGAHAALAHALTKSGKAAEALAVAEAGLRLSPRNISCLNERGLALIELGRIEEGQVTIESALSESPASSVLHSNLGIALRRRGRGDDAKAQYREALRLDASNAMARANLARASQVWRRLFGPTAARIMAGGVLSVLVAAGLVLGAGTLVIAGLVWPGFWSFATVVSVVTAGWALGAWRPRGSAGLVETIGRSLGRLLVVAGFVGPIVVGVRVGDSASYAAGTALVFTLITVMFEPWNARRILAIWLALVSIGVGVLREVVAGADVWQWSLAAATVGLAMVSAMAGPKPAPRGTEAPAGVPVGTAEPTDA